MWVSETAVHQVEGMAMQGPGAAWGPAWCRKSRKSHVTGAQGVRSRKGGGEGRKPALCSGPGEVEAMQGQRRDSLLSLCSIKPQGQFPAFALLGPSSPLHRCRLNDRDAPPSEGATPSPHPEGPLPAAPGQRAQASAGRNQTGAGHTRPTRPLG